MGVTCLPPTTFEYTGVENGFESMVDYPGIQGGYGDVNYGLIFYGNDGGEVYANAVDLNGDGYQDHVLTHPDRQRRYWEVQYGTRAGIGCMRSLDRWSGRERERGRGM